MLEISIRKPSESQPKFILKCTKLIENQREILKKEKNELNDKQFEQNFFSKADKSDSISLTTLQLNSSSITLQHNACKIEDSYLL
ncbi:18081_t:CDS:2 [Gigaspora margarita]|uniref:18081_t:CDS:1 n=1 Tax=Gigaspora margarita TaxID=4874 RepID=A0ABM8W0M7_GIGMA|nr:18081_t:CDS:2 [Gigaspora margarita]